MSLKYLCPHCPEIIEGNIKEILEHEKTHPEHKQPINYEEFLELKFKCSWCGCNQDHDEA